MYKRQILELKASLTENFIPVSLKKNKQGINMQLPCWKYYTEQAYKSCKFIPISALQYCIKKSQTALSQSS